MLNGGWAAAGQRGTSASVSGAMLKADNANCCSRGSWENAMLPRADADGVQTFSRVLDVGGEAARMVPTMLPPLEVSFSERRLTGTIAMSGRSGSAFCSIR